jgi:hypothetical protein
LSKNCKKDEKKRSKRTEAASLDYIRLSVSLNMLFRHNLPMRNRGYRNVKTIV